jgi:di- and tripeptidase
VSIKFSHSSSLIAIKISNDRQDLHSGVEGGGIVEPMFDMVAILSGLSDGGRVSIPRKFALSLPLKQIIKEVFLDFYDNVRLQSDEERELYQLLEQVTGQSASYLTAKWREPSLSIHSVETSGPGST